MSGWSILYLLHNKFLQDQQLQNVIMAKVHFVCGERLICGRISFEYFPQPCVSLFDLVFQSSAQQDYTFGLLRTQEVKKHILLGVEYRS